MLITGELASGADYPSSWPQAPLELDLSYLFAPGADDDGVTVHVPLQVLNQIDPAPFTWQVPGLREELVVALLKSLPKSLRRQLKKAMKDSPDAWDKVLYDLAAKSCG